jgi:integrase
VATFRKRGDRWRAEVRILGSYASATFETKVAARTWATEEEARIRSGQTRQSVEAESWSVGKLLQTYGEQVSVRKRGARWEHTRIRMLQRDPLASEPIQVVGRKDIAAFRDRRLAMVKTSTVNRELNLISAAFTWAVREREILDSNPVHGLARPANPPHRDRRISEDEIERVCAALGYKAGTVPTTRNHEVAVAFLISIETAMRASEVLSLTQSRVDLDARYGVLDRTKNGDRRRVPLSSEAVRLLRLCPKDRHCYFGVNAGVLSTLFRRAARKARIEDLHFHDARHEAATRLARRIDVLDLARMMGVRDLRTLQVYYNATASEIAQRLG